MDEELLQAAGRRVALEHAVTIALAVMYRASGFSTIEAARLRHSLVEKVRRETFFSDDPNISMLQADLIADALDEILREAEAIQKFLAQRQVGAPQN